MHYNGPDVMDDASASTPSRFIVESDDVRTMIENLTKA